MPGSGKRTEYYLITYIFLWTILNLAILSIFPFMHTDESWLAGLSRAMLNTGKPSVTEPFFNLTERAPHALKILFHGIQIIFIRLLGYSLFSVRLLSLLTGTACLLVFSRLLEELGLKRLPGVILMSVQVQFIYASHFARQDIQILLLMLLSLKLLYGKQTGFRRGILAGLPIAAAIGFHPNAFIAAWPAGLILLTDIVRKRRTPGEGAGYLLSPALAAAFFILLSFSFNSGFVSDYSSFGREVGVFNSFDVKLLGFDDFYRKLFLRVSGTYFTPRIWPIFVIAGAGLIYILIKIPKWHRSCSPAEKPASASLATLQIGLAGIIGVNIGILLIGKYSAPSVVLLIPFLVLLILSGTELVTRKAVRKAVYIMAVSLLMLNSVFVISGETWRKEKYSQYRDNIQAAVQPGDSRVIGPLTAEFALDYGRLLDYRNLSELESAGINLTQYISDNGVEYIIYTEELDVIFENRPVWNILYGNPVPYYRQLRDFISENCTAVSEFTSQGYGTRIVLHRFDKDWKVTVYRVVR